MRQAIVNEEIQLSVDRRLIRRLWKVEKTPNYPEGLEFSSQYLYYRNNKWMQIVRIDNQLHHGMPGTHIHLSGKKDVIWKTMGFEEAKEKIEELGNKIITEMNCKGDNDEN